MTPEGLAVLRHMTQQYCLRVQAKPSAPSTIILSGLLSYLVLLPVYASNPSLLTRSQDSVTLSLPGLRGGPFTHLESMQLSGRTPAYFTSIPENGVGQMQLGAGLD
jgi:hypothetical protein